MQETNIHETIAITIPNPILFKDFFPEDTIIITTLKEFNAEVQKMIKIISENEFSAAIPKVITELLAVQKTQMLPMSDGVKLYCEQYLTPNAVGNIVIIHGFTEFIAKYKEMIKYYRDAGFNVFIYDQRGHGLSDREVDNLKTIHVTCFERYVEDLETVITDLVEPQAPKLPLYLSSHSMGGTVSALYMMKHPNAVKKAVMSAPMISPKTHSIPRFLVLNAVKRWGKRYGWDQKFKYTGDFNPNVTFSDALDGSRSRFEWVIGLRLAEPRYQTSASTNSWMREAIEVRDRILNKKALQEITTDILILSAEKDTVVHNNAQRKFAKMLCNCRFVTVGGSKHNIFFSTEERIKQFYNEALTFLGR